MYLFICMVCCVYAFGQVDSSNQNKYVDQNCWFCKNSIVFIIKLWLPNSIFPKYPSASIFLFTLPSNQCKDKHHNFDKNGESY